MQCRRADETLAADLVVVGGGLAGSLAAIEAARTGARTLMVLKGGGGRGSRGNTGVAGGGFAAAFAHTDPADSPEAHFRDTIVGGEYLNDQRLAKGMVEGAQTGVTLLEQLGVRFARDEHGYRQRQAPGHSHPRSVMLCGRDMAQLGSVLGQRVKESQVTVQRGLTLVDLLRAGGRVSGVASLTEEGRRVDVKAGVVIFATGGLGRLFPVTSNPAYMTGDGYAAGYRAGARLRDMEFVQFTPAGLVVPESLRGYSISYELISHPRARILSSQGVRIVEPGQQVLRDLGYRLELIRLFHRRLQSGDRTRGGGLLLDLREVEPEEMDQIAPGLRGLLAREGLDPAELPLEIAPEVHFFVGGLEVDEDGQTTLPGLFAVGEVAGGCHGANRLTHNAFPEILAFAPRAGKAAGESACAAPPAEGEVPDPEADWDWPAALDVRRQVQELALSVAGPVRSIDGLSGGLARLRELSGTVGQRSDGGGDLAEGLATRNLVQVAELVFSAAVRRQESRGGHFREDYPAREDGRWLVNILLERGDEAPLVTERPVDLLYLKPSETVKAWK